MIRNAITIGILPVTGSVLFDESCNLRVVTLPDSIGAQCDSLDSSTDPQVPAGRLARTFARCDLRVLGIRPIVPGDDVLHQPAVHGRGTTG